MAVEVQLYSTDVDDTSKKPNKRKQTKNIERIDPERMLLKAVEVARRLALARSTIYQMMSSGELEVVRKGRAIRVPVESVAKWIQNHTGQAA